MLMTHRHLPALLALALATGTAQPADEPLRFETDAQEYLYYWGTQLADPVTAARIADAESLEWIARGLRDRAAGRAPAFGEEYRSLLSNYLVLRNREAAQAEAALSARWLEQAARERGARRTDSGLVYRELARGSGAQPKPGDTVVVRYTGTLRDGSVFDSSEAYGGPLTAPLERVIDCWSQGIPLMKVGGKARISCPAELGYGEVGTNQIPGGAGLAFEIELLEIVE
jgi:FKBP-type peptidyl-prolyl cis-trans isomerase FkpA